MLIFDSMGKPLISGLENVWSCLRNNFLVVIGMRKEPTLLKGL
jgi:hypothetical protein